MFVDKPGALALPQRHQSHLGRGGRHLPQPVTTREEAKLIQVDAFLAHHDLDHAVQLAQGAGVRHQQTPPHIGLISSSQTLTCTTLAATGTGGLAPGSAAGSGCFAGQSTSPAYCARRYPVAGTTHFLMVPRPVQIPLALPGTVHMRGQVNRADNARVQVGGQIRADPRRRRRDSRLGSPSRSPNISCATVCGLSAHGDNGTCRI